MLMKVSPFKLGIQQYLTTCSFPLLKFIIRYFARFMMYKVFVALKFAVANDSSNFFHVMSFGFHLCQIWDFS